MEINILAENMIRFRTKNLKEQFKRVILKEQSVSFPKIVTNTYNGQGDCDRLHTFSTRKENGVSTEVGGMNTKVGDELKRIYNLGYNPEVTQVDVEVDDQVVTWTAYINESKDGKAWIGITSRGAGCNNDIEKRATSAAVGNDVGTLRKLIIKGGYNIDNKFDLEEVNDYVYNGGKDSFKQVFYRYTRPTGYPPHTSLSSPTDDITITFNGYKDFRQQLLDLPKDAYGDATIKGNTVTITKEGNTRVSKLSGIFDPSEDNLNQRLTDIENKYGYEAISDIVKAGSLWLVVLKLKK